MSKFPNVRDLKVDRVDEVQDRGTGDVGAGHRDHAVVRVGHGPPGGVRDGLFCGLALLLLLRHGGQIIDIHRAVIADIAHLPAGEAIPDLMRIAAGLVILLVAADALSNHAQVRAPTRRVVQEWSVRPDSPRNSVCHLSRNPL